MVSCFWRIRNELQNQKKLQNQQKQKRIGTQKGFHVVPDGGKGCVHIVDVVLLTVVPVADHLQKDELFYQLKTQFISNVNEPSVIDEVM